MFKSPVLQLLVTAAFLTAVLFAFSGGCKKSDKNFFPIPAKFVPTIISPAENSSDVGLWPVIVVRFTYPVDTMMINTATVALQEGVASPEPGEFYFFDNSRIVVFVPAAPLNPGTEYSLVL